VRNVMTENAVEDALQHELCSLKHMRRLVSLNTFLQEFKLNEFHFIVQCLEINRTYCSSRKNCKLRYFQSCMAEQPHGRYWLGLEKDKVRNFSHLRKGLRN